jgi:hypothetical protein
MMMIQKCIVDKKIFRTVEKKGRTKKKRASKKDGRAGSAWRKAINTDSWNIYRSAETEHIFGVN